MQDKMTPNARRDDLPRTTGRAHAGRPTDGGVGLAMSGAQFNLHQVRPCLAQGVHSLSGEELINRDCREDGNTTTGFIDPRFHNCRPEGAEHSNLAVQEMEIDRRGFRIPRESRACAAKPKDKSGRPGPEKQG